MIIPPPRRIDNNIPEIPKTESMKIDWDEFLSNAGIGVGIGMVMLLTALGIALYQLITGCPCH